MARPKNFSAQAEWRNKLACFVETRWFSNTITVLILINACTLGMETSADLHAKWGDIFDNVDYFILLIFTLELFLKLAAYGMGFFKRGWNNFDFFIVAISWFPAAGGFSILRALRILRVLRLFSVVPAMQRVINALGHSIPGMVAVLSVLLIIFYVSVVLATKLFGMHPDPQMQMLFGTLSASSYTLFQLMTLEAWSGDIVRPTLEHFPWAMIFFVPYIVVTSFAVLNLFIGIIVDAMQIVQQEDMEPLIESDYDDSARLRQIEADIKAIKVALSDKADHR
ncbi:MAG: ion transporter [Alphaproteobacteria bacterium]